MGCGGRRPLCWQDRALSPAWWQGDSWPLRAQPPSPSPGAPTVLAGVSASPSLSFPICKSRSGLYILGPQRVVVVNASDFPHFPAGSRRDWAWGEGSFVIRDLGSTLDSTAATANGM